MADAEALDRAYVAALNAGDVDGVLECFADDCVFEDVAVAATSRGAAELREMLERLVRDMPDFHVDVRHVSAGPDHYCAEVVVGATLPEAMAAGGQPWEVRAVSVGHVADGKITRNSDYWNAAGFLVQVGALRGTR